MMAHHASALEVRSKKFLLAVKCATIRDSATVIKQLRFMVY